MFSNVIATHRGDGGPVISPPARTPHIPPPHDADQSWEKGFALKLQAVRQAARRRYEHFLTHTLFPVFEQIRDVTSRQGVASTTSPSSTGGHSFKFTLSKHASVTVTFGVSGLECDVLNEFSIPHYRVVSPTYDSIELLDADDAWARQMFEQALSHFADGLARRLGPPSSAGATGEPVGSSDAALFVVHPEPASSPETVEDELEPGDTDCQACGAAGTGAEDDAHSPGANGSHAAARKIRFRPAHIR